MLRLDQNSKGFRNAFVEWSLGSDGNRIVWVLLATVLLIGFGIDLFTAWGEKYLIFQRSGALLTAIFVPWFAVMFGKLSAWRSRLLVEQARIDAKELFSWYVEALAKSKGLDRAAEIDRVLKLSPQKEELAAAEPTVALLESASMVANAVALFTVTIVWGFGDLVMGCVRKLVVQ